MQKILIVYLVWNFIVFIVYGIDKMKAQHSWWRISEKTLMLLALFMGGAGAYMGMQVFRHKTKHSLFTIGVPLCILSNIITALGIIYFLSK